MLEFSLQTEKSVNSSRVFLVNCKERENCVRVPFAN